MELREIAEGRSDLLNISLKKLVIEDGFNVRRDYGDVESLAKSLAESGQKEALTVRLSDDWNKAVIVDGHRRLAAAKIANEKYGAQICTFFCVKEKRGTSEETRIVDMFLHNSGKPLEPLEEAEAFRRLINFNWESKSIALKVGKSTAYVNDRLNLLGASHEVREQVRTGKMTPGVASKLARIPKEKQEKVLSSGKKIRIKDVEKVTHGNPSVVSTGRVKKIVKQAEELIQNSLTFEKAFWRGVVYGCEVAIEKQEFSKDAYTLVRK